MGDLSELKTGKIRLQQSNDRLVSTPTKELRIVVEKCSAVTPVKLGPPPQEHSDEEQEQGMDVESDNEQPQEVTEEEIPVEISKIKQVPVIGRISQLQQLNTAIPDRSVTGLPGALFLWGAPATGKSFALDSVLEKKDVHVIKIHSSEILCGRRAFFETFVKQLVRIDHKLDEKFRCDSLRLLYSNVYEYLQEKSLRVVAVIEGAETLRGEHDDILRMLISLQDITQCQICTVLISTLPPGQFMPNILDHSIIPIFFPQYTMEELNSIIVEHISPRCTSSKSSNSSVSHWDSFQQLIDTSQEVNLTRLWKKLEPQMKAQFFQLNSSVTAINSSSSRDQENTHKTLEMPMNAKYLLIASYLATHNPPSSDKRFFVKSKINKAKKSRLTQTLKTDTSKPTMRSFELNRLHAIFGSIQLYCDDKAMNKNRNISFMTLLTSLCQNKLVQHLGEDSWGNHKYKCLLDYDTVLEISRSVNFELNNYLHRLL
ncbi:Origin recognition complex subunit 5 [Orchesella cincta]|uniref:Origin recognition complex subunit 5 n=1 Tax=Orchesella cincta TaxID=48709 RepID=A0A1D2MYK3_ORCCI|nr:Origin recognition complex subunit 5 [Orchesella cincta]